MIKARYKMASVSEGVMCNINTGLAKLVTLKVGNHVRETLVCNLILRKHFSCWFEDICNDNVVDVTEQRTTY